MFVTTFNLINHPNGKNKIGEKYKQLRKRIVLPSLRRMTVTRSTTMNKTQSMTHSMMNTMDSKASAIYKTHTHEQYCYRFVTNL